MKFVTALCIFIITVVATPTAPIQQVLRDKHTKCASIEDYSVQWFIDNAPKDRRPAPSTCLFYTFRLTEKARWYAKNNGMKTIWDVWPGGYYDKRMIKSNPLREIMQNKEDRRTYFSNMSIAWASLCDIYAMVMDNNVTPTSVACDVVNKMGIWFNGELPALQRGNKVGNKNNVVYQIQAISPAGGAPLEYWSKWKNPCNEMDASAAGSGKLHARSLATEENKEWWDDDLPTDIELEDYALDDPSIWPVCER
ncbi:hypothetical protein SLS60_003234 [Paraconiothyrium brasiliense]|uniref:Uncharacterized protein n=1 Tax=Paraconiothyrium brasiliense TaxID=300254 RepID=A0ABR3RW14_9PLEO